MEIISSIRAWVLQYAVLLLAGVAAAGWAAAGLQTLRLAWLQSSTARAATEAAEAQRVASERARQREHEWSLIVQEIDDGKQTELRAVADQRDAALLGLRNRARERLPSAATAACAGASPAQLSESDAAVAVRLAADADNLRANYAACKSYVEKIGR